MNPLFVAILALYGGIIATHVVLRLFDRNGIPMLGVVLLVAWMLVAAVGVWAFPVTLVGIALLLVLEYRSA